MVLLQKFGFALTVTPCTGDKGKSVKLSISATEHLNHLFTNNIKETARGTGFSSWPPQNGPLACAFDMLRSRTVFNIDNDKNCFLSSKTAY